MLGTAGRQLPLHGDQQHGVHLRRAHPPRARAQHFLPGLDHVGEYADTVTIRYCAKYLI